jgi:anti-anti-sigma factor
VSSVEAVRLRVPFDALDLATVDPFLRWAKDEIACPSAEAAGQIVLDLELVEFVMAAGVQALLELEDELCSTARTLAVANPAPIVARVLEICSVADRWIMA